MKSGIYKIENLINGKIYVGKTLHLNKRFKEHLWELKKGKHFNEYLQNSWNKYGEENFKFSILEEVSNKDILYEKELEWILRLKANDSKYGYNSCLPNKDNGGVGEHSEKSKELMRKKRFISIFGEYNEEEYLKWKQMLIDRANRIKLTRKNNSRVLVFNKDTGEHLYTFNNVKETAEALQLNSKKIVNVLNTAINSYKTGKKTRSYKGYKFVYKNNFKEGCEKVSEYHIQKHLIKMYNENGELVGEFYNARHAADFIGCRPGTISSAISVGNKLRNGYTVTKDK